MNRALSVLPEPLRSLLVPQPPPEWVNPMLATLTGAHFSREGWYFERKLDGVRCLAFRDGERVRLMSRNQKSLNNAYPELVGALRAQPISRFVLDGEIVALSETLSSFSLLQQRMQIEDPERARATGIDVFLYVFDLPYLDGYDLSRLPLHARKTVLEQTLTFKDPLRYSEHRETEGQALLAAICAEGGEGVIAKDASSLYVHARSDRWLKFKCVTRQEFVIGGFTEPKGARTHLGALLVGYYDQGVLHYAGKVGTGFDRALLADLRARLDRLSRRSSPFEAGSGLPRNDVHWVEPELVGEITFTEWTTDGKLRHPSFTGLRSDKDPRDVVREVPTP